MTASKARWRKWNRAAVTPASLDRDLRTGHETFSSDWGQKSYKATDARTRLLRKVARFLVRPCQRVKGSSVADRAANFCRESKIAHFAAVAQDCNFPRFVPGCKRLVLILRYRPTLWPPVETRA
jgi:hypothetical protein